MPKLNLARHTLLATLLTAAVAIASFPLNVLACDGRRSASNETQVTEQLAELVAGL